MPERTCSIPDCGRPHKARGWCNTHYEAWRQHGDPLTLLIHRDRGSPEERFWAKVDKDGPIPERCPDLGPCWLWVAARIGNGYGNFWDGHRVVLAHRFAYELLVGPIPDGLEPDHLCRVRHCVNPAHLEPVTHGENARRGEAGLVMNALQRAVTHCPKGHAYTAENTSWWQGHRKCRACDRERHRRG